MKPFVTVYRTNENCKKEISLISVCWFSPNTPLWLNNMYQTSHYITTVRQGYVTTDVIITIQTGFHADLNETYPVGRVDDDAKKLIRTTRKCLDEAINICKPGALFRDLGKIM